VPADGVDRASFRPVRIRPKRTRAASIYP